MVEVNACQECCIFYLINAIIGLVQQQELGCRHLSLLLDKFKHHLGFFVATHDLLDLEISRIRLCLFSRLRKAIEARMDQKLGWVSKHRDHISHIHEELMFHASIRCIALLLLVSSFLALKICLVYCHWLFGLNRLRVPMVSIPESQLVIDPIHELFYLIFVFPWFLRQLTWSDTLLLPNCDLFQ